MNLRQELNQVVDHLTDRGIPYALCGGMALAVHGHPRFTQDLDLLVTEPDVERIVDVARQLGYQDTTGWLKFHSGSEREVKIYRLVKPITSEHLILDLICVTRPFEIVWSERTQFEISGRRITVVSRDGLRRMKQISDRPQDRIDLETLDGNTD